MNKNDVPAGADTRLAQAALSQFVRENADVPPQIDGHEVLCPLGEGGMGTVYCVRQKGLDRLVALKTIRRDLISSEFLQKFREEINRLATLSHPGIATIFTAGPSDCDQPYYLMELVANRESRTGELFPGVPITEHIESRADKLDTRSRVQLLIDILEAVQHAHGRKVVHRDLKPSNILVDHSGRPKVVDFGIAQAIDSALKPDLQFSGYTGTAAYMSPEQLESLYEPNVGARFVADKRWDVYAAGVIAYQVLSGHLPYPIEGKTRSEVRQLLAGQEPRPLSSWGDRDLRGELDYVIGKAIAKEPNTRYASVAAFKSDLKRFLAHRPIRGYRASAFTYQALKFCQRYPWQMAFSAATVVVFIIASIISFNFGVNASRAAALAQTRLEQLRTEMERTGQLTREVGRLQSVAANLELSIWKIDPYEQKERPLTLDYLLEGYVQTARSFSNRAPDVSGRVLMAAGRIFDNSGRAKEAIAPLVEGVSIWRTVPESDTSETLADGLNWLSWAYAHQQPALGEQAVKAAQECLDIRKKKFGIRNDDTIAAMADLSAMLRLKGDTDSADDMFLGTLALSKGLEGTASDRKQIKSEIEGIVFMLALSPDNPDTLKRLDKFLEPLLNRPRLRGRLPWTLAQFGKHVFQHHNKPAGTALLNYAVELGKKILGSDAPDVRRCEELRDSLK